MNKIKGFDELSRNMDAYVKRMGSNSEDAVEKATDLIVEKARALAPVDTGELRKSIRSTVKRMAGDIARGQVEAAADYALFVEYGTEYMKPQPFLEPAIEDGIKYLMKQLESAHNKAAKF